MSEDGRDVIATNLQTKGDKARAVAQMGQVMLKKGFTHTHTVL